MVTACRPAGPWQIKIYRSKEGHRQARCIQCIVDSLEEQVDCPLIDRSASSLLDLFLRFGTATPEAGFSFKPGNVGHAG